MDTSYYVDTSYGYNAAYSSGLVGGLLIFMILVWVISILLSIIMVVSMWKIFKKLGKPGWASIIPFYNMYVMCEIAEKKWWYILLLFVPFVNIYAIYVIYNGIAKKFGKETGFVIGMMFLPIIFFPILAFSENTNVSEEITANDTMQAQGMDNEPNTQLNNDNVNVNQNYEMPGNNLNINENNIMMSSAMLQSQNDVLEGSNEAINEVPILNDTLASYDDVSTEDNGVTLNNNTNGLYETPTFDSNDINSNDFSNQSQAINEVNNFNNVSSVSPQTDALFDSFTNDVTQETNDFQDIIEPSNTTSINTEAAIDQVFGENQNVQNQNFDSNDLNANYVNPYPTVNEQPVQSDPNKHTSLWSNNNQNNTQM